MKGPLSHWIVPALLVALVVNVLIFLLLPLLSQIKEPTIDAGLPVVVNIARLPVEEPEIPEERPSELKEPPSLKPDNKIAEMFAPDILPPRVPDLEATAIPFSSNPNLLNVPSSLDLNLTFNVDELDQTPRLISKIEPRYPFKAERLGIEGYVKVKFIVDKHGSVSNIKIIEARPKGVFENSVMKSLPLWKFLPGRKYGEPVAAWVEAPINFKLE